MYNVYLGKLLCPVAPDKISFKIKNKNKTTTLINEGEINVLKDAGLTDISFTLLLPNQKYPFAVYKDGYQNAAYFLGELEKLKTENKPFQFIIIRSRPNGKQMYNTNLTVSLEDYEFADDAKDGFDVKVKIKLKQFREYGTKIVQVRITESASTAVVSAARPSSTANSEKPVGIGSEVIVTGQLHDSSYGDAPGKSLTNYRGKINFINKKGSHPYHVTTPSGGWLGWVTKDSVKAVE